MDNVNVEKQNNQEIDFNEELRSFTEMFCDMNLIPNSRYRLVENTEEAKPGYCNGILNEHEVETLRKVLSVVEPGSMSLPLELCVSTESVYKMDIKDLKSRGTPSKQVVFSIGNNVYRGVSVGDSQEEKEMQSLLLTIMRIVERRVKDRALIEFMIV